MIEELAKYRYKTGGTVVELGSRDGHDAAAISKMFEADRTVVIEANPYCHDAILATYPAFECYNLAIAAETGKANFWAMDPKYGEVVLGQSSLLYKPSYDSMASRIVVDALTMDDFTESRGIDSIEVMKIDVEGATYEVLTGFSKIRMTRLLHIESEHRQFWEGQRLYEDTVYILEENGYEQVFFAPVWTDQSDTIWLRKD